MRRGPAIHKIVLNIPVIGHQEFFILAEDTRDNAKPGCDKSSEANANYGAWFIAEQKFGIRRYSVGCKHISYKRYIQTEEELFG